MLFHYLFARLIRNPADMSTTMFLALMQTAWASKDECKSYRGHIWRYVRQSAKKYHTR